MHWSVYEKKRKKFLEYVARGNKINAAQLGAIVNKHRIKE